MSFNGLDKLGPGWEPVKISEIIENGPDCYPWREVYAWWPRITVGDKLVWGKKIYKRKVWVIWGTGFHMEPTVQYATDFDIIAGRADLIGKTTLKS